MTTSGGSGTSEWSRSSKRSQKRSFTKRQSRLGAASFAVPRAFNGRRQSRHSQLVSSRTERGTSQRQAGLQVALYLICVIACASVRSLVVCATRDDAIAFGDCGL